MADLKVLKFPKRTDERANPKKVIDYVAGLNPDDIDLIMVITLDNNSDLWNHNNATVGEVIYLLETAKLHTMRVVVEGD
jgi:hypothetical protein